MADGSVTIAIKGDSSNYDKALNGVEKKTKNTVGGMSSAVMKGMFAFSVFQKGAQMLASGIKSVISAGMGYEAAMSEVQAISGATAEEFERLNEAAKEAGRTTIFSASQAAEALKYMALAGWDAEQSVAGLDGVLALAAASGMDLGTASDYVTDYISAFGMGAEDATYMADLMTYANNKANTSALQLGEAYKNSASFMHGAGQDIETTTALLMGLANQGQKGSEAGTKISSIMRDITQKMKNGKIMIGDTAVQVLDANGNFRDMVDILKDVEAATAGMGSGEMQAALAETFSAARSIPAINALFAEGLSNIDTYEEGLRNSAGTAAEVAEVMTDNLKGDITKMGSAFEALELTAYDSFDGIARQGVQMATEIINALNTAGQANGLSGMIDELFNQVAQKLPTVLKAVQEGFTKAVGSFVEKLPNLLKTIMSALPDVISNGGNFLGSLAENVGSIIGIVLENIISSAPQWIPALAESLIPMLVGLIKGAMNAIGGLFTGALELIGVDFSSTSEQIMQRAMGGISAQEQGLDITIVPTANVEPIERENITISQPFQSAIEEVVTLYTDGNGGNDQEAKTQFKHKIDAEVAAAVLEVNGWRDSAIATLTAAYDNGDLTFNEYQKAVAEVNTTADNAITDITQAGEDAKTWADNYAGAATSVVESHTYELEGYMQRILGVEEEINRVNGTLVESSRSTADYMAQLVSTGKITDAQTNLDAVKAEFSAYEAGMADLAVQRQEAIEKAQKTAERENWSAETYNSTMDAINAVYDRRERDLTQQHDANNEMLYEGLLKAYGIDPEGYAKFVNDSDLLTKFEKGMMTDVTSAYLTANENGEDTRAAIAEQLMQYGLTDEDYSKILKGLSERGMFDPNDQMYKDLSPMNAFVEYMNQNLGWDEGQGSAVAESMGKWLMDATKEFALPPEFASVISGIYESGAYEAFSGLEFDEKGAPTMDSMFASFVKFWEKDPLYIPPAQAQLDLSETKIDTEGTELPEMPEMETEIPVEAQFVPEINESPWTQFINILNDPNATAEAKAAAKEALSAIYKEMTGNDLDTNMDTDMMSEWFANMAGGADIEQAAEIGRNVYLGLVGGMQEGESAVSAEATTLGTNAVDPIGDSAGCHSPSVITKEVGNNIAQGLINGMNEKIADVQTAGTALGAAAASSAQDGANSVEDVNISANVSANVDFSGASASAQAQGNQIGSYLVQGIEQGIASRAEIAKAKAVALATAMAQAIRDALKIQSPSRVMMEIGDYMGQGLEIGIDKSFGSAIKVAENMVGSMNLRPSMGFEGLQNQLAQMNENFGGESGNIYFNLNGKTLAQATAGDNNTAINAYTQRVAMGFGRG